MNKENKTLINISWSFAEKVMTETISSLISIVLARFILPEYYGLVTMAQIFISVTQIFVSCGLRNAIVQKKDASEEQISTVFYINVFLGLILYVILFLLAPLISKIKNEPNLILLIRVLAFKIPIASVYSIQHGYIQKRMEFKKFFFSSLFGTLLSGIVGIVMAVTGWGVWAIVFSSIIDQIMDCIILFFTTKWIPKFNISIAETIDMITYGLKILASEFISRTYQLIRPIIIAIKYTTADLAFNSKGNKFAYMAVELINESITKVMFPKLSSLQDNEDNLKNYAKKVIQVTFFFMCPIIMGIASTSYNFVPIILTDKWNGCVPYIVVYCLMYVFTPIDSIDRQIIEVRGRADLILKEKVINVVLELVSVTIAIFAFDDALSIAISMLIVYLINCLINIYFCKKVVDYGYIEHFETIKSTLIISILMSVSVYLLGLIKINRIVLLVIQVISGIFIYVGLSILLKIEPITYVIDFIRGIKK